HLQAVPLSAVRIRVRRGRGLAGGRHRARDPLGRHPRRLVLPRLRCREGRLRDGRGRAVAPGRVIIVGPGIAGATAAQTLRKEGFDGDVVMIGADRRLPYRRTMLTKDLLSGRVDAGRIPLRSADAWRALSVEIRTGTRVEQLDPVARSITTED